MYSSQDTTANYIYMAALGQWSIMPTSSSQSSIHSSIVLVAYDALISLSQEIRCIWKRRFGTSTIIYLVGRYGTILNIMMQIVDHSIQHKNITVSHHPLRCNASFNLLVTCTQR